MSCWDVYQRRVVSFCRCLIYFSCMWICFWKFIGKYQKILLVCLFITVRKLARTFFSFRNISWIYSCILIRLFMYSALIKMTASKILNTKCSINRGKICFMLTENVPQKYITGCQGKERMLCIAWLKYSPLIMLGKCRGLVHRCMTWHFPRYYKR